MRPARAQRGQGLRELLACPKAHTFQRCWAATSNAVCTQRPPPAHPCQVVAVRPHAAGAQRSAHHRLQLCNVLSAQLDGPVGRARKFARTPNEWTLNRRVRDRGALAARRQHRTRSGVERGCRIS